MIDRERRLVAALQAGAAAAKPRLVDLSHYVVPQQRRGRPRADRIRDLETGMRAVAIEVFRRASAAGNAHGALTSATRDVAKLRRIKYPALKRAVSRYARLRFAGDFLARLDREASEYAELRQRLGDVRKDSIVTGAVWRLFADCTVRPILKFLRQERIDGHCPRWLIDAAVAIEHERENCHPGNGDLVSPNRPQRR